MNRPQQRILIARHGLIHSLKNAAPYCWPLLAGAGVLVCFAAINSIAGVFHPLYPADRWPSPGEPTSQIAAIQEARARIAWGSVASAYVVVTLGASFVSIWLIHDTLPRRRFVRPTRSLLLTSGWVVASVIVGSTIGNAALWSGHAGLEKLQMGVALGNGSPIYEVTSNIQKMGSIAVVLLFVGFAAVLSPNQMPDTSERDHIALQGKRLCMLLWTGATLLFLGTLETYARYCWPASIWAQVKTLPTTGPSGSEVGEAMQSLAAAAAARFGTMLSLLLVAAYVPPALILRRRLRERVALEGSEMACSDRSEALADMRVGPVGILSRIVATMGPFIAGLVLPKLFSFLAK
jgi:hypothetical protein